MKVYKFEYSNDDVFKDTFLAYREQDRIFCDSKISHRYEQHKNRGKTYSEQWNKIPLVATSDDENIFTQDIFYMLIPPSICVSQKIYDTLAHVLDDNIADKHSTDKLKYGELLPLKHKDGSNFYLFHPPVLDILDEENSYIYYRSRYHNQITTIYIHNFFEEKLQDAWVFRLPKCWGMDFYVTEQFKDKIEQLNFKIPNLQLIWDSQNPNLHDERWNVNEWNRIKHEFSNVNSTQESSEYPQNRKYRFNETPLDEAESLDINNTLNDIMRLINNHRKGNFLKPNNLKPLTLDSHPKEIVEAIKIVCESLRKKRLSDRRKRYLAGALGVLWCEQVCRTYSWKWISLNEITVIASPQAHYYIDPCLFMNKKFNFTDTDSNITLFFETLEKTIWQSEIGEYIHIG